MRSASVAELQLAAKVPPRSEKRQREEEAVSFAGFLEGLLQPVATGPSSEQTAAEEVTGAGQPSAAGQGEGIQAEGDTAARRPDQASTGEMVEVKGVNTALAGELFWPEVLPARPGELLVSLAEGRSLVMLRNPVKVSGEEREVVQAAPGPQGQVAQGAPGLTLAAGEVAENIPWPDTSRVHIPVDQAVPVASPGMKNKESSGAQGPEVSSAVSTSNNGAETAVRVGVTREESNEKLLLPRLAGEDFSASSPKTRDNPAGATTLSSGDRVQGSWGIPAEASHGGKIANLDEVAARLISTAQLEKKGGRQELELQLRPEGLGKVRLHTVLTDNRLSVQMLVETPQAGRLLQMSLPELRQLLLSQGLELEQLLVEIDYGYSGGRPDVANREGRSNAGRSGFLEGLEQEHLAVDPVGMSYVLNYLA